MHKDRAHEQISVKLILALKSLFQALSVTSDYRQLIIQYDMRAASIDDIDQSMIAIKQSVINKMSVSKSSSDLGKKMRCENPPPPPPWVFQYCIIFFYVIYSAIKYHVYISCHVEEAKLYMESNISNQLLLCIYIPIYRSCEIPNFILVTSSDQHHHAASTSSVCVLC